MTGDRSLAFTLLIMESNNNQNISMTQRLTN